MKRLNWTDAKETLFNAFTHNEDEQSARAELDAQWGIRDHADYYRCCGVWPVCLEKPEWKELGKSIQRTFPKVYEAYKDGIKHKATYEDFVAQLKEGNVRESILYSFGTSYFTADMILLTYL